MGFLLLPIWVWGSAITQPCLQVFSVNGSIICSGLHFWRHFDINGSIIFGGLQFWRHWFNMAKILSKFGEQDLVMVNYASGFNQSETGKYFEWIIIFIHIANSSLVFDPEKLTFSRSSDNKTTYKSSCSYFLAPGHRGEKSARLLQFDQAM